MKNFSPDYLLQDKGFTWILIDFDDVIHTQSEDFNIKNKPIAGVKEALTKLKKAGFKIVIFTARHWVEHISIKTWLRYYKIPFDSVICGKPLGLLFIDDKAYRFKGNWKKEIKTILKLAKKAYNQQLKKLKKNAKAL